VDLVESNTSRNYHIT